MVAIPVSHQPGEDREGAPVFPVGPVPPQSPEAAVTERDPHPLNVVVVVTAGPSGIVCDFIASCLCGWNSGPLVSRRDAELQVCAVGGAEVERAERQRRYGHLVRIASPVFIGGSHGAKEERFAHGE